MLQPARLLVAALCVSAFALSNVHAQEPPPTQQPAAASPQKVSEKKPAPKSKAAPAEEDPMAEVRRTTAITLVTSLAEDARTFRDPTLRARVQARAADALWDTEREKARTLFRRAWDEAEAADAENDRRIEEERRAQMRERGSFSIRMPPSLRTEVLRLAAKRERELGEEFLTRMEASKKDELANSATSAAPGDENNVERQGAGGSQRRTDPNDATPAAAKRLRLAVQLLEDGDIERAIQFADPALTQVSSPALEFLARLRPKNAKAADERYVALVRRAALDPSADPNTASLLSSYLFTPSLYITFSSEGGSNSNSWGRNFPAPTDISPQLRAAYFNTAATILLRPLPPADQDRTSTGRAGWYMVIARLLPLFDRHAPDKSAHLRARMAALVPDTPERVRGPNNSSLTRGLVPEDPNRDHVQESLNRLTHAKTPEERDAIYVDAVLSAMRQKDSRVEEFLNKIEDLDLRKRVRAFVDFEATERAIRDTDITEALRLARGTSLTSIQRTWALTEVARLLSKENPGRALEILEESLLEAKRIDDASPERASALVAIATQFYELDRPRAWEVMTEVVKASDSAAGEYTGEDGNLSVRLQTKNSTMMSSSSVQSFDLTGIFAKLAREDLSRAVELARGFGVEAPRAVATLAVARAVLSEKKEAGALR
ncbi:MAG TPA: hypothetical protein VFS10_06860 [Pyrinomonadaceae bacterium]|nr:hypothetical protein [Pyrinomonadaceae bacterium]